MVVGEFFVLFFQFFLFFLNIIKLFLLTFLIILLFLSNLKELIVHFILKFSNHFRHLKLLLLEQVSWWRQCDDILIGVSELWNLVLVAHSVLAAARDHVFDIDAAGGGVIATWIDNVLAAICKHSLLPIAYQFT